MFILNASKVSVNEVNIYKSNPWEQKPQAPDRSEYSVSNSFFLLWLQDVLIWSSAPGMLLQVFT